MNIYSAMLARKTFLKFNTRNSEESSSTTLHVYADGNTIRIGLPGTESNTRVYSPERKFRSVLRGTGFLRAEAAEISYSLRAIESHAYGGSGYRRYTIYSDSPYAIALATGRLHDHDWDIAFSICDLAKNLRRKYVCVDVSSIPVRIYMGSAEESPDKRGANATVRNVFVDGGTIHNGRPDAQCGTGVYFPDQSVFNSSLPVEGAQNNGRAEAAAISHGLKAISRDVSCGSSVKHYIIYSDSQYAIELATRRINGPDRDIATRIFDQARDLRKVGVYVEVSYIPGHCGHLGNETADKLAFEAASREFYPAED